MKLGVTIDEKNINLENVQETYKEGCLANLNHDFYIFNNFETSINMNTIINYVVLTMKSLIILANEKEKEVFEKTATNLLKIIKFHVDSCRSNLE